MFRRNPPRRWAAPSLSSRTTRELEPSQTRVWLRGTRVLLGPRPGAVLTGRSRGQISVLGRNCLPTSVGRPPTPPSSRPPKRPLRRSSWMSPGLEGACELVGEHQDGHAVLVEVRQESCYHLRPGGTYDPLGGRTVPLDFPPRAGTYLLASSESPSLHDLAEAGVRGWGLDGNSLCSSKADL